MEITSEEIECVSIEPEVLEIGYISLKSGEKIFFALIEQEDFEDLIRDERNKNE